MKNRAINEIFSDYFDGVLKRSVFLILGLFVIVELFFSCFEISRNRRLIEKWTNESSAQVAQAVFLQNLLSLEGLVKEKGVGVTQRMPVEMQVDSISGEKLFSTFQSPVGLVSNGWQFSIFDLAQTFVKPLYFADRELGRIVVRVHLGVLPPVAHSLVICVVLLLIFILLRVIISGSKRILSRHVSEPLQSINEFYRNGSGSLDLKTEIKGRNNESALLFSICEDLERETILRTQESKEKERLNAMAMVAAQVVHDIKSPLSALNVVISELKSSTDAQRIVTIGNRLLGIAYNRILEIISNLNESCLDTAVSNCSVLSVIESVTEEKRLNFNQLVRISIDIRGEHLTQAKVNISKGELSRCLSNLLDNSYEAIDGEGQIDIKVGSDIPRNLLLLTITDNGSGVPKEVLPRLFERGGTFGKQHGSGFGLFYAKQVVEKSRGTISVIHTGSTGTELEIALPLSN